MFKVAIVCMSDKGSKGEREDISTQVIEKIILENGYKITKKVLIPDDFQKIKDTLIEICDNNHADLILTTGGTGFSKRDVTPEATEEIIEKRVPGIPEAIRAYSLTITKRAMLSRATAGIRKDTLIINMPGSPKAVEESLTYIISELKHGLEILVGSASECARK
ncbi:MULTISPECIES: MogA/MoaB family molybdenum cofactor biosynthesis protein [Fusobacterium]|jgi:molybdopterin adenylyltransferase|uniref:Molybdenum cofactor biosynthesis protein B n=1 Tax=Fusobacterium mortiferum TaxID=850 RepID=A0A414Q299_FUSMR|nr:MULTISPECIES: MogA/MoaB family molybdenum cofactor biosynthesis protein [Fusobacterium]MCI6380944.1 MogA/MoaB family molybdenum cofactor biosynthesis protein [Fusobacterium mortiferum]MDD7262487.1 MogA/MoaB family molybdenum cofactor biosynthesis protein [Fusobacterium mortiferum]MDY5980411.1 MogA/MoaB family molybdenum cofactor biosynthesis protein [Fusobacterium mortiferum]MSS60446.1 MogA/MoaB family molybdenum cofactor biosynthesis protein [Fusobacterium sp. FSA-380-WT-2B]RGM98601.1 MogA